MSKTLQQKIEELEAQGWVYDDDFRVSTHIKGTLKQLTVLKKGNYYRSISGGKIGPERKIMSDEDFEHMNNCEY